MKRGDIMANLCGNQIHIKGSRYEITRFLNYVKSENREFDFNTIIPAPEDASMDWRFRNWATKWNAYDISVGIITRVPEELGTFEVYIFFDTAWSPPIPVFIKMYELFQDVSIDVFYEEEGMAFYGYFNPDGSHYEGNTSSARYRKDSVRFNYYDEDYWEDRLADEKEDMLNEE